MVFVKQRTLADHNSQDEYVKKLVEKSGFPLEMEVSSVLASNEWRVSSNSYYLDLDENKGRELDIKAGLHSKISSNSIRDFRVELLIQCKKIPGNVWVIFEPPYSVKPVYATYSVANIVKGYERRMFFVEEKENLHYGRVGPICVSFDEYVLDSERSNKKTDNLFESCISLVKATQFARKSSKQSDADFYDELRGPPSEVIMSECFTVYYPVIVFEGPLYSAKLINGKTELNPRDMVTLYLNYVSGRYDIAVCIDIVGRNSFQNYFHAVMNDIKELNKLMVSPVGEKVENEVREIYDDLYHGREDLSTI